MSPTTMNFIFSSVIAIFVLVVGLFIVAGRHNHLKKWNKEQATVLQDRIFCDMRYYSFFSRHPEFIETINCSEVPNYIKKNHSKYSNLQSTKVNYIQVTYRSLAGDTRWMEPWQISAGPVSVHTPVEILVHPKYPYKIDKLPVDRDITQAVGIAAFLWIMTFSLFCFKSLLDDRLFRFRKRIELQKSSTL